MAKQIQIRRDTAANWTSADPTLAQGEIGFETDTSFMKIGDGSTAWTSLSYFPQGGNLLHKYDGTTAPTVNEDSGDGYGVGSNWYDITNDKAYVCLDATTGAAVWTETTAGAAGGEANTASNVGTGGVGVFKQKTGVDLEFKKINAGSSKITITDDTGNDEVDIDVSEGDIDLSNCDNSTAEFISANNHPEAIGVACSDESSDLTTGTAKATFRMPFAMTLTEVRANVNTAPAGSTIIVDINESGTTVLSTKITIDASEKTSETAANAPVISDSSLADDAEITIDIDQVGSSTAGKGLKVWLIGTRT